VFEVQFGLDTGPQLFFPLVCCPVDNMSLEVSPENCYLGVSGCYCCYGNHTAGSKQFKNFYQSQWNVE